MKRVNQKWFLKYFGWPKEWLEEEKNKFLEDLGKTNEEKRKIQIIQCDGGRGTWDHDVPTGGEYTLLYQSSSKTYFLFLKQEGSIKREK